MKLALKEDIYRIDKECRERYGISVLVLMENAGNAAFGIIRELFPDYRNKNFLVLCGPGITAETGRFLPGF